MTKKKHSVGLRMTIVILLLLAIGIGGVAYWQRNTIQALIESQRYSAEERKVRLNEQEAALLQKISEEIPEVQVKPLSEEEAKLLQDGTITPEEAVSLITGKAEMQKDGALKQNHTQLQKQETVPSNLENLLAQIYVLEASFNGKLDSLVAQAKQEVIDGKGKVSKYSVAKRYVGRAAGLEGQCDSQMESLLSQIKAELERTGNDTGIVNEIRSAYAGKKSAKKAELMGKYSK